MSPDSLPHYFGDQIKEDEMVGTCRMHMIAKNVYQVHFIFRKLCHRAILPHVTEDSDIADQHEFLNIDTVSELSVYDNSLGSFDLILLLERLEFCVETV
jgi:hypothetical protein